MDLNSEEPPKLPFFVTSCRAALSVHVSLIWSNSYYAAYKRAHHFHDPVFGTSLVGIQLSDYWLHNLDLRDCRGQKSAQSRLGSTLRLLYPVITFNFMGIATWS